MVDFKVIRESFYRLRYLLYIFFLPLWWLQLFSPRRRDVWIFGAWYGRRFSDNSKYLYMYVNENCPDIRAIWLTRDKNLRNILLNEGRTVFLVNDFKAIYFSLIAKYVIISSGKQDVNPFFINGAIKVQLWHGNPIKKIGLDDSYSNYRNFWYNKTMAYLFPFIYEHNYDYAVSNAQIFTKKLSSAFGVPFQNIFETGNPRNDIFFSNTKSSFIEDIRNLFFGCKIVFYLPTFRDTKLNTSLFKLDDFNISDVEKFLLKENIVLVSKGHYVDNQLGDASVVGSRIIHLSDSEVSDINFLLKDADLLITDYSGAYFDFLLTNKPQIFAAFDLQEYLENSREMYFEYSSIIGGPIVTNWKELFKALENIWDDKYYSNLILEKNELFNKYRDSYNSKRVYQAIESMKNKKQIFC